MESSEKSSIKESHESSSSSEDEKTPNTNVKPKNKIRTHSSKKISAKTPLESIKESETFHDLSKSNSFSNCFGVKSYLHEFYENNHNSYESQIEKSYYYERIKSKNKRLRILWKIAFWTGICFLLSGLSMLIIGYSIEEKPLLVHTPNNLDLLDKKAIAFNSNLESCKVFGLFIFTFGGLILAGSLVASSFICYKQCLYNDDIFDLEESPINIDFQNNENTYQFKPVEFKQIQPQSYKEDKRMQDLYNQYKSYIK